MTITWPWVATRRVAAKPQGNVATAASLASITGLILRSSLQNTVFNVGMIMIRIPWHSLHHPFYILLRTGTPTPHANSNEFCLRTSTVTTAPPAQQVLICKQTDRTNEEPVLFANRHPSFLQNHWLWKIKTNHQQKKNKELYTTSRRSHCGE